ncbi:zinc finger C3HC4 type domain containing protein [Nitzschia inconspicua]|uniref:Zinc finger C3HC4 type domain containing protein n=1 Tax=Nitzschia inconspicua TaxID=303405 RepID=A0A9K3PUZ3_9STRA|nr:zinc finger C3HC4 type domain containing protein [Nitzschia inconspicua]
MTTADPTPPCCQLCFEMACDTIFSTLANTCSHGACQACLTKWIHKQEQSSAETVPCPFCRVDMSLTDMESILGRPFQPRADRAFAGGSYDESDLVDDLTRDWLMRHTRQCPNCHSHIEKLDGCDKMECLCGCRFCFQCGIINATCTCTSRHHVFWDNIRDHISCRNQQAVVVVDVADTHAASNDCATVTLGEIIARRRHMEDNRTKREFRSQQREAAWAEVLSIESLPLHDLSIYNGFWLYKQEDSMKFLQLVMDLPKRQWLKSHERCCRRICCLRDLDEPRLGQDRTGTEGSPKEFHNPTPTGFWLFAAKTSRDSLRIHAHLMNQQFVQNHRRSCRQKRRNEMAGAWCLDEVSMDEVWSNVGSVALGAHLFWPDHATVAATVMRRIGETILEDRIVRAKPLKRVNGVAELQALGNPVRRNAMSVIRSA